MRLINVPDRRSWRSDLRGGVQAAAVALPMGLAFGVVSGLGPVAGLYSAICTGFFAALFGGTPTQIAGPTGPIAIVMASLLVSFADDPFAVAGIVLLAGLLQIGFGALRLGRYIGLVPYPVTSGFATGVGCIIIVMQLNPLIGQVPAANPLGSVLNFAANLGRVNWTAFVVAATTFAACQFMPKRLRRWVPVHLSVLVIGSAAVALLHLGVPRLAAPESLLPHFSIPPLHELPWSDMWISAIVLALISSIDSLVTSTVADSATQQFHNSERELVGQGIGNVVAGLLGALPGAGSAFRTMANIRAGGKTPLSGVSHAMILLGLLLALGGLIRFIPSCVLAGILIYIGIGIIDWSYIKRFAVVPPTGVVIMVVVWLMAVFVNVVTAVAVGMIMASLALVKRMADLQLKAIDETTGARAAASLSPDERESLERSEGKTLLIPLSGPLTFGAAYGLTRRLTNLPGYRALVLELTDVPLVDESAIVALENIIRTAHDRDQAVLLVGLRADVLRAFNRFGHSELIRGCTRFRHRLDALNYAAELSRREQNP